jgi:AhpD family alkylhydroperoxidase
MRDSGKTLLGRVVRDVTAGTKKIGEKMANEARLDRLDFIAVESKVFEALGVISRSAFETGIERQIIELTKVRASQINGCAFSLQYHVDFARQSGVSQAKLDQVSAWPKARIFSPQERAALAWTESLTELSAESASDDLYNEVRAHFSDVEVRALTIAIGHINLWHRLAIAFRMTPPEAGQRF